MAHACGDFTLWPLRSGGSFYQMLQKNVFVCNKESPHLVMEKIKFECTARREEVKWGSHYSGGKIANIWERFLEIHFTFWLGKKKTP